MRTLLLVIAVCITATALHAQKRPFKPGKIKMRDLEMEYYPGDSTVNAAILYDYGYFDVDRGNFSRMRRIKIFTKEGLNQLIFEAPVESKGFFSGFVMNAVDGKIEKERISRDHIFVERSGRWSNVRVAPPNVREGSVVDISYNYNSYPAFWQFQLNIPVRYSELYVPGNENYSFRFTQIGYETLEVVRKGRYIARNMPAFRSEPFTDSRNNYMTAMLIDLQKVHFSNSRGMFYKEVSTSWDAVNEFLCEVSNYYDSMKEPCFFLGDAVDTIAAYSADTLHRISKALEVLHGHMRWNELSRMYPSQSIKEAWEEGTGNSADMNFLFMILMRKLDIPVNPVLTSHRSRGKINPYFPTLNRFNYTLSLVKVGGDTILIDASDKYAPLGMLPDRCLNGGGFMVDEEKGKWIDIAPEESHANINSCVLKIDDSGVVTGNMSITHSDYGAISFRRNFDDYNSIDDYLEAFEKDNEGILVEEYQNNIDAQPHGDVIEKMAVEIEGNISNIGDLLTINPVFLERIAENPFKLEKRVYPVDFTTPQREMSIFNLTIPEGYTVQQLPEPVSIVNQEKSIMFQYKIQQNGRNIQLAIMFDIRKPVFLEHEYEELKMLYNLVVQKEQENIILKKSTS